MATSSSVTVAIDTTTPDIVAANDSVLREASPGNRNDDYGKIVNVAKQIVEGWSKLRDNIPADANLQKFDDLIFLLNQLTAEATKHPLPLQRFLEEGDERQTFVERDPPHIGVAEKSVSPSASSFSLVADSALSATVSDDTVIVDKDTILGSHTTRQQLDEITLRDLNEKLCRIVTSGQATKNIIARATDLIHAGADVNAQDEWCDGIVYDKLCKNHPGKGRLPATVLYAAVASNADCDVIRLLLNQGADINGRGGFSGTPLQAVVTTDDKDLVRLLLNRGADMNPPFAGYGCPILLLAARYGTVGIMELLLERGAQIMDVDSHNRTALHDAAFNGHIGMIKLLLDRGAVIDAQRSDTGATPLSEALRMAHGRAVQVLLARGADVTFLPPVQDTYADSIKRGSLIDMLKEYGAEYTCSSPDIPRESIGNVPIYKLVRQGNEKATFPEAIAEQCHEDVLTKEKRSLEDLQPLPGDEKPLPGDQKKDDESQTPPTVNLSRPRQAEETCSVVSFQTSSTMKTATSWRRKLWSRFSSQTTLHDDR